MKRSHGITWRNEQALAGFGLERGGRLRVCRPESVLGPQAVLDGIFMRLATEWDGFSVTAEETIGSGDTVIARGRYRGMYKGAGVAVNARSCTYGSCGMGRRRAFSRTRTPHSSATQ